MTAMVVEDDPTCSLVTRRLLEAEGVSAEEAATGGLACQMVDIKRYDLILLDAHLPDMHGSEVAKKLRRSGLNRASPVVVITSDDSHENVQRCLSAGVDEIVVKPFDRAALGRLVQRWILVN